MRVRERGVRFPHVPLGVHADGSQEEDREENDEGRSEAEGRAQDEAQVGFALLHSTTLRPDLRNHLGRSNCRSVVTFEKYAKFFLQFSMGIAQR